MRAITKYFVASVALAATLGIVSTALASGGHGGGGMHFGGGGGGGHFGGAGSRGDFGRGHVGSGGGNGGRHGGPNHRNGGNPGGRTGGGRSNGRGPSPGKTAGTGKNPGRNVTPVRGGGKTGDANRKPSSIHHPRPGGHWDKNERTKAWNAYWYHKHPKWMNGGWYWYSPDAADWIVYDGEAIPEDQYFAASSIRIRNPDSTGTELNYSLNDSFSYTIQPGEKQGLPDDQSWVIQFDRGDNLGNARYTLDSGEYYFGMSDHGWELYRSDATTDDAGSDQQPTDSLASVATTP